MIDVGSGQCQFACDECPIIEDLDYRLALADQHGFQFDHCGCDKVGTDFFISGYCEDAWVNAPPTKKKGQRKTGRAYRRKMNRQKFKRQKEIAQYSFFSMGLGIDKTGIECIERHYHDPDCTFTYTYIKRKRRSTTSTFWKKHSNRLLRRKNLELPKGNQYRRVFDYWWEIF